MFSFVSSAKLRSYCYLIYFETVKGFSPNKSGYIIETSLRGDSIFVNFSLLSEEHIECIFSFFKLFGYISITKGLTPFQGLRRTLNAVAHIDILHML